MPAPAGLYWIATDWTPVASVAVAATVVEVRNMPGAVTEATGPVLSTILAVTDVEARELPAASNAMPRRS